MTPSGRERQTTNLLDLPWVRAILSSRWYPGILAYPTLAVFSLILYLLLWGPTSPSANLGTSLTWVLWWPLIPLLMFALGRFWCAICPFGRLIDLVQSIAGLHHPVPSFLKRYGIWVIDATFIFITWSDHVWGIVESPRGSGYLLGLLVTAVVVTGVLYERRTWCRYLCFLGGLSGNYSRCSSLQLRTTPDICATCKTQQCYRGNGKVAGCPIFEFPRAMQTMANCNFCGNCIKTCPNNSIQLIARRPTRELWFVARPKLEEAFLAVVIVGIVLVQNVTMLAFWEPTLATLTGLLFGSQVAAFTLIFLAAMAAPFGLVLGAAALARSQSGQTGRETVLRNFARFGYAVIPLDLAGHIAHNLFHLLSEGGTVAYNTAALLGLAVIGPAELVPMGVVNLLQFAIVGLGLTGAVFTAYKIAEHAHGGAQRPTLRTLWPYLAVLLLFGLVNLYLFTLPMVHRV